MLQLRREFHAIAEIDGRATLLMSSWPDLVEQLVQLSKAEATTCPIIRMLLLEYEAGAGMDNPTGLWSACEGLIFLLLLSDLIAGFVVASFPDLKRRKGPGFSYLRIISDLTTY